ncbi:putative callose synthase 6 [Camellia lanceoleosa]|uniref:Callose synthase 6 n=1 Tax=Camellia lanceoleosa TaxID=1840588 RepID=A0ACC0H086_9ERIC|nr:putative callose synthase 6 [Camellia lanceoleosa]
MAQTMANPNTDDSSAIDNELVQSSLAAIAPILYVANEVEKGNPRVAYIFHDDWINPPEIDTNVATATTLVTEPSTPVDNGGLESSGGDGRDGNKERSIISVVTMVMVFILVVEVILGVRWRRKRADKMGKMKIMMMMMEEEDKGSRSFSYDLDMLVAATDNFSSANRLLSISECQPRLNLYDLIDRL